MLARNSRGGLSALEDPRGDGFPLDAVLPEVIKDNKVSQLLLPRQLVSHAADSGENRSNKRKAVDEMDAVREENKRLKAELANNKNKGSFRKGGGKGAKGKGKQDKRRKFETAMPRELVGMSSVYKGKPICFDYNMQKGCANPDGKCHRGDHICAFPTCGGDHPCFKCSMRKA